MSLVNAARFARWHGEGLILPAHAFLGIVDEGTGVAVSAMQQAGVDLAGLRQKLVLRLRVRRTLPRRLAPPVPAPVLLSLLEKALAMSQSTFNHRYVGTEHLYLSLLDARVPAVVETLSELGQEPSALKRQLFQLLGVESAAA